MGKRLDNVANNDVGIRAILGIDGRVKCHPHDIRVPNSAGQIGNERQPFRRPLFGDQFAQSGLVHWRHVFGQTPDRVGTRIPADDVMAGRRQATRRLLTVVLSI